MREVGFSRPQGAACEFLDAGDERRATGRAAGAVVGADRLDQGGMPRPYSPRGAGNQPCGFPKTPLTPPRPCDILFMS
jgi:hypothetical protein